MANFAQFFDTLKFDIATFHKKISKKLCFRPSNKHYCPKNRLNDDWYLILNVNKGQQDQTEINSLGSTSFICNKFHNEILDCFMKLG